MRNSPARETWPSIWAPMWATVPVRWRPSGAESWRSSHSRTSRGCSARAQLTFRETMPGRFLRGYSFVPNLSHYSYYNRDPGSPYNLGLNTSVTFLNIWSTSFNVTRPLRGLDAQLTRGGPANGGSALVERELVLACPGGVADAVERESKLPVERARRPLRRFDRHRRQHLRREDHALHPAVRVAGYCTPCFNAYRPSWKVPKSSPSAGCSIGPPSVSGSRCRSAT